MENENDAWRKMLGGNRTSPRNEIYSLISDRKQKQKLDAAQNKTEQTISENTEIKLHIWEEYISFLFECPSTQTRNICFFVLLAKIFQAPAISEAEISPAFSNAIRYVTK